MSENPDDPSKIDRDPKLPWDNHPEKMPKGNFWNDNEIPMMPKYKDYKTNSHGYRCPEFSPLPSGGKNVVVLGCSHTFGEGVEEHQTWVHKLKENCSTGPYDVLRWWNLGYPGASGDFMVRVLYGTEKVLFPKLIICCWPAISRRERLEHLGHTTFLVGGHEFLKYENGCTDRFNLKKNIFFVEKFAEHAGAKVFHCFADQALKIESRHFVYKDQTLKSCWPLWDREKREETREPDFALDGRHFGLNHHETFAKLLSVAWQTKLK